MYVIYLIHTIRDHQKAEQLRSEKCTYQTFWNVGAYTAMINAHET